MKRVFTILIILMFMLLTACGLGGEKTDETSSSDREDREAGIEIVIENGLEDSELTEIWIDPSDQPWSENLLDDPVEPGEEFTLLVDEPLEYDIQVIDGYGESYTIMNQSVDEDGFEWEVVYEDADWSSVPSGEPVEITVENGLWDDTIWYVYCTLSSEDAWGSERLDYMVLEEGESFTFEISAGDYYDFYARNDRGDFFFSFDNYIDESGFSWKVSERDLDNTLYEDETHGASAPVSLINRLGNVSILYAYEDESGGESWGDDLMEGDVLEPREEFTFYLRADRFYDFHVQDELGNTYTLYEVAIKDNGIFWEVIQDDID